MSKQDIDIDTDEFLSQLRAGWVGAAEDHLAYEQKEHPYVDEDEVRTAVSEVAREEAEKEQAYADSISDRIQSLQEQIQGLAEERREALALARAYESGYADLIQ